MEINTNMHLLELSTMIHIVRKQIKSQVAKANGGHIKKNVWEIMQCPEYALKCNKSVHLPACLFF